MSHNLKSCHVLCYFKMSWQVTVLTVLCHVSLNSSHVTKVIYHGIIFSCFTSSHVKLCYITLWHVTSFQVTWHLVSFQVRHVTMLTFLSHTMSGLISCDWSCIPSYHFLIFHVMSSHVTCHYIMSPHFESHCVLCHFKLDVKTCNVMDCLTSCHFRFHIMSFKSHSFGSFLFVSCNLM